MKTPRTFRIDSELSKKLDAVCVRYGDATWHIENALRHYLGAYKVETNKDDKNESK